MSPTAYHRLLITSTEIRGNYVSSIVVANATTADISVYTTAVAASELY